MKLIVVKNINVARRFAEALNIQKRERDYFKAEHFYITWVVDWRRDKVSAFVPSCFNSRTNHIQSIQELLKDCLVIIAAVSSQDDLELFEEFYEDLKINLSIQKMSTNSLTRKSIQKELENLMDINDLTKFLNRLKQESKPNIRDIEIKPTAENQNYNTSNGYQIQLSLNKEFLNLNAYSKQLFPDEQAAKEALATIVRRGGLLVNDVKYETHIQQPPLLYNLDELRDDCKSSFGFTEYETLSLAESLYEKGMITYPNTEAKSILKENWIEIKGVVLGLKTKSSLNLDGFQLKSANFSKRIVNDNSSMKMEGIYPTGVIPTALNLKENKIYDLIALRLLESLSNPCKMKTMQINLNAVNFSFQLQAFQLVEAGWRNFQSSFYKEQIEICSHLPQFAENEILKIESSKIFMNRLN